MCIFFWVGFLSNGKSFGIFMSHAKTYDGCI